ncbi:MAG: dihydrolipoyl dehydrogenase [Candidatus Omnitrophota bacterium]|jgi:dihydrolipoamide dehydrogenase
MYDLTIIGAGWAGFNAAMTAKKLGLKTALVERSFIGGACLNHGCIPTKTLIQSSKVFNLVKKSKTFGIDCGEQASISLAEIQKRKDSLVAGLRRGMEFMLKGLDYINSEAQIISSDTIKTAGGQIKTKHILIASGSKPVELEKLKFNKTKIISSDEMVALTEIPRALLIVGGGVIGCEFASLFSSLGSTVAIAELSGQLLPGEDRDVSRKLEVVFKKKNITVMVNTDAVLLDMSAYDLILVCVGRKPNFAGLYSESLGLAQEKGRIVVDDYGRTTIPTIYAAGDCTGKLMLAHFAAYQGRRAVENMAAPSQLKKINLASVPNCIFTEPEIASIGLSEEQAKAQGIPVSISKFDFLGSGMARILDETEGFLKINADSRTSQILGASIIGPKATELISIISLAIDSGRTTQALKEMIFPHPTLSESISEALS